MYCLILILPSHIRATDSCTLDLPTPPWETHRQCSKMAAHIQLQRPQRGHRESTAASLVHSGEAILHTVPSACWTERMSDGGPAGPEAKTESSRNNLCSICHPCRLGNKQEWRSSISSSKCVSLGVKEGSSSCSQDSQGHREGLTH